MGIKGYNIGEIVLYRALSPDELKETATEVNRYLIKAKKIDEMIKNLKGCEKSIDPKHLQREWWENKDF